MPVSHPHRPLPGLRSRFDRAALAARLQSVDLVAVDIDECIFPGYSQSWLGYLIMQQLLTRPERLDDLRHVPQLIAGGVYIQKVDLLRRLERQPTNRALMARYVQSMRGIPEGYFLRGAERIPGRTYAGAAACLALLGRRAPLGLISLGVHVVAGAYRRWLDRRAGATVVAFIEANQIVFEAGGDGRARFSGYAPPLRVGPADKLRALEHRLDEHGARCPLVLGNSVDEASMAALARARGGLSVGYRPTRAAAAAFDLQIHARDWRPLNALLGQLLG